MAVVMQRMVDAEVAGVMFTVNPITGNTKEVVAEAVSGLGEALVNGEVTPEHLVINRDSGKVQTYRPGRCNRKDPGIISESKISENSNCDKRLLNEARIKTLLSQVFKLENLFNRPQDIELAFDDKNFYVLRIRPVTGLRQIYPGLEWEKILDREYGVQYTEISLKSLCATYSKDVPYAFNDQVYIPDEGNQVCFIGSLSWETLKQECEKFTHQDRFFSFEEDFYLSAEDYLGYTHALATQDLRTLSNTELSVMYQKYQKKAINYFSFIWSTYIVSNIIANRTQTILHGAPRTKHVSVKDLHFLWGESPHRVRSSKPPVPSVA